jgi:hypothetical protein
MKISSSLLTLHRIIRAEFQPSSLLRTSVTAFVYLCFKRTMTLRLEDNESPKSLVFARISFGLASIALISVKITNFLIRIHEQSKIDEDERLKLHLQGELAKWKESIPRESSVNVEKVAKRISNAIENNSNYLNLINCNLQAIPPVLLQMLQLERLALFGNQISVIPPETRHLQSLKWLNLSNNQISVITPEIGQLQSLKWLSLCQNRISVIPPEIGQMQGLERLALYINQISVIPPEIGQIQSLKRLALFGNQISVIPPEIGQLQSLEELNLSYNQISVIPPEIVNLPFLFEIYCSGTKIPFPRQREIETILERKRAGVYLPMLPDLLDKWKEIIKLSDHSLAFIDSLEDRKKTIIADWLLRIEKTPEYKKGDREEVAEAVCEILKTVGEKSDFAETFFNHAAANNTGCEDRAGMALNEIYCLWTIATLDKKKSTLEQKIQILLRAVKSYAFRYYISKWLQKNEANNHESVEVFLFYENLLKRDLNLISIVKIMTYGSIGNKLHKLSKQKVLDDVNESYLKHILVIPSLEELISKEDDFIAMWNPLQESFQEELGNLADDEKHYIESERIFADQKEAKKEKLIKWLESKGFLEANKY